MFYNINNVDDFWSRIQTAAVNFNVFPSFVKSLPDFRRFLMILYNTPSHYCCGFSLSCTPSRSSGEKKRFHLCHENSGTQNNRSFCCGRTSIVRNGMLLRHFCGAVVMYLSLRITSIKGISQTAMQPSLLWIQADLSSQMKMVPGTRDR